MAYSGFLVKVGNYTIPNNLIKIGTYKAVKNALDIDSYRDANGQMHRTVLDHFVCKVEMETKAMLNERQMADLITNIQNNYSIPKERKANVTAFIPELGGYVTQEMYMPDFEPTIYALANGVQYNSMRLAFIGY